MSKISFSARSSFLFQEVFFDSFIEFALDFSHVFGSRIGLEIFLSEFNIVFDFAIFCVAFGCLTSGLFGGFNNRH